MCWIDELIPRTRCSVKNKVTCESVCGCFFFPKLCSVFDNEGQFINKSQNCLERLCFS